ncbi:hypothetical protein [Streptomyces alkaliterrae]|uniref:DUF3592 domain-containing protein n=1 Tax=Streptomyces alkaliterrae TaxID=2213162 RepID=A0A5P0YMV7_9ACTN|nr:hypothetical protein [Streptomyces alkaliterrae]MBB1260470.1 hypothetical protein [Streptomyces alkaliterrae]MQS01674.1 hypothetical protein [Streptomyces alkaliterrae]
MTGRPRSTGTERWAAGCWGLLGLALGVVAAALLLVHVPERLERERDFDAVGRCAADRPPAECRRLAATVREAVSEHRNRKTYHRLTLTDAGGTTHRVEMLGRHPVFDAVSPGDPVTMTVWREQVRRVDFGELRQETTATPTGAYRLTAAAGLSTLAVSLGFLWAAWWWARRHTESPEREPRQVTVVVLAALGGAAIAFVAPLATDDLRTALLVAAVGEVPVAVVAALLVRHHRRRAGRSFDVTPRRPEKERCFPGTVLGEVPYAVPGYDHLVAAPGLLAATPDPTGRVARRPLPGTLVVERVRLPHRGDPGGTPGPGSHVVQCRDGGTPVFIVTDRADVPWVLGALGPRREALPRGGGEGN